MIAVVGILPYIALLHAWYHDGLEIVVLDLAEDFGYQNYHVSWFVVGALAIFTMLFGTRHIDNTEHHRGMMMAVAFESIVKPAAFFGLLVCLSFTLAMSSDKIDLLDVAASTYESPNIPTLVIYTILTMLAIVCLLGTHHGG